jgi:predicted nucleotidyltransferase
MKRDVALQQLNRRADALKAMGATALYMFGSTVRDEAGEQSDLDLFIDYDRDSRFSLISLLKIKHFLEDEIGTNVDIATRDSLHPRLRAGIEQSAYRVF